MGSAKDPTKTAKTARVQTNTVAVDDLPPVSSQPNSQGKDLSITIPLTDVNEGVWRRLNRGDAVSVMSAGLALLQVTTKTEYLGTVPPQYVETVLERQLLLGSCVVVGEVPADLRVRLSAME